MMAVEIQHPPQGKANKGTPSQTISVSAARLLAALKTAPRLTSEDADYLAQLIESTREDSVADELPD